jgi:formate dehydrogenase assembly factor FdhD
MTNENEWVEVASVSQDEEADLIAGFLRSEGIEAQIDNRKFHVEPVNFGDMAQIRILTGASDAAAAREMLDKRQSDFQTMQDRGDENSILTDSGPADAPEEE